MARIDNLKNTDATKFKAGPKQAEVARKGGIASGVAKRKKGEARRILSILCNLEPQMTARRQRMLESIGADPKAKGITAEQMAHAAFFAKVMSGDLQAYKLFLELYGEDAKTILEEKKLALQKEAVDAIKNADGFMEAMHGVVEEVFDDGGDTPDTLEDSE